MQIFWQEDSSLAIWSRKKVTFTGKLIRVLQVICAHIFDVLYTQNVFTCVIWNMYFESCGTHLRLTITICKTCGSLVDLSVCIQTLLCLCDYHWDIIHNKHNKHKHSCLLQEWGVWISIMNCVWLYMLSEGVITSMGLHPVSLSLASCPPGGRQHHNFSGQQFWPLSVPDVVASFSNQQDTVQIPFEFSVVRNLFTYIYI